MLIMEDAKFRTLPPDVALVGYELRFAHSVSDTIFRELREWITVRQKLPKTRQQRKFLLIVTIAISIAVTRHDLHGLIRNLAFKYNLYCPKNHRPDTVYLHVNILNIVFAKTKDPVLGREHLRNLRSIMGYMRIPDTKESIRLTYPIHLLNREFYNLVR